jgi:hypothetical protein
METDHEKKFLLDPYLDRVTAEGPPVHEDFGLDLLAFESDMGEYIDETPFKK